MTAVDPAVDPAAVLQRLRAQLPDLPPSEARLAEHLLAAPEASAAESINGLARSAGTSVATVQRLCHRFGLGGYPALRLSLVAAATRERVQGGGRLVGSDITSEESTASVVEKLAYADARAIQETAQQLDPAAVERAVAVIARARRTDVYGVGASGLVAADLQHKLLRIGRTAMAPPDPHLALTSAALLTSGDAAVAFSHSGTTPHTVETLLQARRSGATTVAVTNHPSSPLALAADVVLTTVARETTFRSGAMASRIAQLLVVDVLFVGVARGAMEQSTRALNRTRDTLAAWRGQAAPG